MRRVVAAVVVALALVGGVVAGTPASADVVDDGIAPVLRDVQILTPEVGPGETLRVAYDFESDQPLLGPGSWLRFSTTPPIYRGFEVPLDGLPMSGTVTFEVPGTLPNETYRLDTVTMSEQFEGVDGTVRRRALYYKDGKVYLTPTGMPGPVTHTFDLLSHTFAFSGSTLDPTPPHLTAVSVSPRTLPATGGTVQIKVSVSEPLAELALHWGGRAGVSHLWTSVQSGEPLTLNVPAGTPLGRYSLLDIHIVDEGGNYAYYYDNGSWNSGTSWGVTTSGTHRVAMSSAGFNVGAPAAPLVHALSENDRTVVTFSEAPQSVFAATGWIVSMSPAGHSVRVADSQRRVVLPLTPVNVRQTVSVRMVSGPGISPPGSTAVTARDVHRIFSPNDWDHDGDNDVMAADDMGRLWLYRGTGTGAIAGSPSKVAASGWQHFREMAPIKGPSYVNGRTISGFGAISFDGRSWSSGQWESSVYPFIGNGPTYLNFRQVIFPGDVDGNGWHEDILAIADNGDLYLVPSSYSLGHGGAYRKIGSGWTAFPRVVAAGDVNGDRYPDVFGIRADGSMVVYLGNGHGGFLGGGRPVSNGWNRFAEIFSPGDFSGDQRADLIAVMPDGRAWLYRGNGNAGFTGSPTKIASNWSMFL